MAATLTDHAAKRAKERLGVPKRAALKNADRALEHGLRLDNATGDLKRYMSGLNRHRGGGDARIYGEHVYIFVGQQLITVYRLPREYQRAAEQNKRKQNGSKHAGEVALGAENKIRAVI